MHLECCHCLINDTVLCIAVVFYQHISYMNVEFISVSHKFLRWTSEICVMSDSGTRTQDALSEPHVLCGMDCYVLLADIFHTIRHVMRLYAYLHCERFKPYNYVVVLFGKDICCNFSTCDKEHIVEL
jgi:hypothetical protein